MLPAPRIPHRTRSVVTEKHYRHATRTARAPFVGHETSSNGKRKQVFDVPW